MRPGANAAATEPSRLFDWAHLERSSVIAAVATSPSGRILWANRRFLELLSSATTGDPIGQRLQERLEDPAAWPAQSGTDRAVAGASVELRIDRGGRGRLILSGDVFATEFGDARECLLGVFTDSTEVETLRAALGRSARLETVGSLTSGIAHDFNNLLTVLVGNLALLAEDLRGDPKRFAKLKAARDAANRGSDLIRQLLAFAREQPVDSDLLNPARVIGKITSLIDRALGSRIELETRLDPDAGSVRGNAAQLESVVVNLAINARDALETGGKVRITIGEQQLDPATAASHGLMPGSHLCIKVADNGSGIDAATLDRVFEPFFSTKLDRGGNGLGLSMVRAYAGQYGGAAAIESAVGEGTEVSLLFPRIADGVDESVALTMPLSTLPTGDEAIVVVSPEDEIRSTVAQILTVLGYAVRSAEKLGDANLMLRERAPDLLIVDGFDARALIACNAATDRSASYRVVQLSSDAEDPSVDAEVAVRRLVKPFSLADLAGAVREALDA